MSVKVNHMYLLVKLEKSKKNFAFLDLFKVKLDVAILLRSASQKNARTISHEKKIGYSRT